MYNFSQFWQNTTKTNMWSINKDTFNKSCSPYLIYFEQMKTWKWNQLSFLLCHWKIDQWSKICLVLNAKSRIQIFNEIYAAYRKTAAVAVLKPCTLGGLASKSAQFLYIIQWCNNVFLPEVLRGYINQALI